MTLTFIHTEKKNCETTETTVTADSSLTLKDFCLIALNQMGHTPNLKNHCLFVWNNCRTISFNKIANELTDKERHDTFIIHGL